MTDTPQTVREWAREADDLAAHMERDVWDTRKLFWEDFLRRFLRWGCERVIDEADDKTRDDQMARPYALGCNCEGYALAALERLLGPDPTGDHAGGEPEEDSECPHCDYGCEACDARLIEPEQGGEK